MFDIKHLPDIMFRTVKIIKRSTEKMRETERRRDRETEIQKDRETKRHSQMQIHRDKGTVTCVNIRCFSWLITLKIILVPYFLNCFF